MADLDLQKNIVTKKYSVHGKNVARRDWNDFMNTEYGQQVLYEATLKNGGKLSKSQLSSLIGGSTRLGERKNRVKKLMSYYDDWYALNYENFTNAAITEYNAQQYQQGLDDYLANANMPEYLQNDLNDIGLNNDYQTYLDALNAQSEQEYNTSMQELNRAENEMYRSIGLSQRQFERDIAKRRQQALKSGMSTAQLAAQEQQNILAAQTGATQIAQDYANQRYNTINQFANSRAQNYTNTLGQQLQYNTGALATNRANWASGLLQAYAQKYAADKEVEASKH